MEKSDAPQGQDQSTNKTDKSQNNGPVNRPVSIAQNASPQEEHNHSHYHSGPAHWWQRIDWSQVVLDVLLLVVGIKLAFIYSGQLNQMIESNRLTRLSLNATQRAFVSFDHFNSVVRTYRKNGKDETVLTFSATLPNGGNTPASNAITSFRIARQPHELTEEEFVGAETHPTISVDPRGSLTLGPLDLTESILGFPLPMTSKQIENTEIVSKYKVFFYGWVVYRDTLPDTPVHVTEFCKKLQNIALDLRNSTTKLPNYNSTFISCDSHNCNDEYCKDYDVMKSIYK